MHQHYLEFRIIYGLVLPLIIILVRLILNRVCVHYVYKEMDFLGRAMLTTFIVYWKNEKIPNQIRKASNIFNLILILILVFQLLNRIVYGQQAF